MIIPEKRLLLSQLKKRELEKTRNSKICVLIFELLKKEKENKKRKTIVFAEKCETHATRKALAHLFQLEFDSNRHEYPKTINGTEYTILYLNLSETKNLNNNLDVVCVICFEYCNPRVQEVEQNVRKLRGMFDVDKLRFVFYTDQVKNEQPLAASVTDDGDKKSRMIKQMREYLECVNMDNLESNVFLLDEQSQPRLLEAILELHKNTDHKTFGCLIT